MDVYLIKFGGNAIRGKDDMLRLSKEISEVVGRNRGVVVVHGGGPEISAEMERRGLAPRKVAGVRVTDPAVLEVAEEVLRRINKDMVAALSECGVKAVGIPGYHCTLCRRKAPYKAVENGKETTVDLGLVGEVADVNAEVLKDLLAARIVPVVYPIGEDEDGVRLNVNADAMASGIAAGVGCREMLAVTDVPGVLMDVGDPSSKRDVLTLDEVDGLIAAGVISGGMIPKVEACRDALNAGVGAVRMVDGKGRNIITDALKGMPQGTVIVR
ncbi:MAG: acetylglutamate kinase [Candidatus Methanoplasma sp.]|jgi:acetylglutamate kinase|nr:acetylglutamate kinase [Candidatus Methanoplasma sp.]